MIGGLELDPASTRKDFRIASMGCHFYFPSPILWPSETFGPVSLLIAISAGSAAEIQSVLPPHHSRWPQPASSLHAINHGTSHLALLGTSLLSDRVGHSQVSKAWMLATRLAITQMLLTLSTKEPDTSIPPQNVSQKVRLLHSMRARLLTHHACLQAQWETT